MVGGVQRYISETGCDKATVTINHYRKSHTGYRFVQK